MKYETIKTLLLAFLVVLSTVLTWNLWTFQPQYEFNDSKYVHEVSISEPKDTGDIIQPLKIYLRDNQGLYGIMEQEEMNDIIQLAETLTVFNIEPGSTYSKQQIRSLTERDGLELLYPGRVPFSLFQHVFKFETEEDMPGGSFDRIIIQRGGSEEGDIYFVSSEEGMVVKAHMDGEQVGNLFNQLKKQKTQYSSYEQYKLPDGRSQYLPIEAPEMTRYKYYSDTIDTDKFMYALFDDPAFTQKSQESEDELRFMDSTSMMDVDLEKHMIFYVNPSQALTTPPKLVRNDLLEKSMDFINEHAGWTDNYRYFSTDVTSQKTVFRLFVKGYPAFNQDGMAEMKMFWGTEKIYQFSRPYFVLDVPLPGPTQITLPTGEETVEKLLARPGFEADKFQDLVLGYTLRKDPNNSKVLILDPDWYYLYENDWQPVEPAE